MPHATRGWANTAHPSISQQHALGEMLMHKGQREMAWKLKKSIIIVVCAGVEDVTGRGRGSLASQATELAHLP
jgi:hypothetical protein